jgi:hypothetical protein
MFLIIGVKTSSYHPPEPITSAEVTGYVAWMALRRTTVTVIAVSKPVYDQVLFFMHQYCYCDSGFKPSF